MLRSLGYWISHWQVRLRTDGTSTAVCLFVSRMLFCCISPDQVPAWWCLDQDSFTPWAEWRTPTWTAGKTTHLCCMFNMAHTDSGQMSALCLSTGQWLLSEAPRIVTRRQQAPFRSFLRYSTSSLWKLSPCWCSNDLTYLSTCCLGGGVSPLQQVLSQAQQFRSHPLSGREGGWRPYCCVPLVTSARLQKWEMQIVFICLFCPKAVRCSMYGRPGACYVDIAGDMVNAKVDRSKVRLGDLFFCVWYLVCHCRCVLPLPKSVFVPQGSVLLPTSTLECSWLKRHRWRPLRLDSSQKTSYHHWKRWRNLGISAC